MTTRPETELRRLCFVIPTLNAGGTEKQLLYLIGGFIHDYEISLICTRQGGALIGDARRMGAHVYELNGYGGWDISLERKFRRIFRAHRPQVMHAFLFGFDLGAARAARAAGVPVVVSSRRELATWKKPRHIRLQHKANALADAIVANSHAVANFAADQENESPARYTIIYNGVDAEAFCSNADTRLIRSRFRMPPETHVIGLVANFSPVKDHGLFLDMAGVLMKRRRDVHFLMLGCGPRLDDILGRVVARGWTGFFTHTAAIVDVPDLYKTMSVAMLCSEAEGFPNTLMEAMAAGVPVVAPAVGGIPELISDGETGRLVTERNAAAFADTVAASLDNVSESKRMAELAAARVRQQYRVEDMVNAHRSLYSQLLANAVCPRT